MPPESARQLLRETSLELARLRRIRGASHKTWRRITRARARLALAAALLAVSLPEPAAAVDPLFRHGFMFDGSEFFASFFETPSFADIDGDGDQDVFVRAGIDGGPLLFVENTGTPSVPAFASPSSSLFGLGATLAPDFADIDADGDLDAFTAAGDILFFENTGAASAPAFAAPSTNPFGLAAVSNGHPAALADIDGDGDLDVFVGTQFSNDGETVFFENTGTAAAPAFAAPATNPFGLANVATPQNSGYSYPDFVDVDGDGDLDAFIGSASAEIFFFENTGTVTAPTFSAPQTNAFGLMGGLLYVQPAFADVDGDGDFDALVGGYGGYNTFAPTAFENTGSATSPAFSSAGNPFGLVLTNPVQPYASPTFADLDGDGDLDALIGNRVGQIVMFQNTGAPGTPVFAAPQTGPFGLSDVGDGASPEFADADADGDLDAFVGNSAGNILFFANTGSTLAPAFAAPLTNPAGLADVGSWARPALADLDGDGDLDALVGASSGSLFFFRNTGSAVSPSFAASLTNPFGLTDVGSGATPAFVDADVDGDLDVFVGETNDGLVFFRNTGSVNAPAFAPPSTNPFGFVDGGGVPVPDFADLDGDGDLDGFVGEYRGWLLYFENVSLDPDACTDGLDNDGDGRIDLGLDAGCANAADTSELSALQCDNGLDDDGDGKIDWRGDGTGDPHCSGLLDDRELPPPAGPGCGIGPELLLLGPLLAARRRRPAEG